MNYLQHAERYKQEMEQRLLSAEQAKFELDMELVTATPSINPASKNLKRNLSDLYIWQNKVLHKTAKEQERKETEYNNKLSQMKSVKIINPNSELMSCKSRNFGEKIEDRLLREGAKVKSKTLKLQEEHFNSTRSSCGPPKKKKQGSKKNKEQTMR